jgi:ribokinase
MSVVVFGSINMDMVVRVARLPAVGETLTGHGFVTVPGGKGANQAVAAARLGAPTQMVGRVGDDVFGAALLDNLAANQVGTGSVTVSGGPSGVAAIAVSDAGENTIVVVPGANGLVGGEDLPHLDRLLGDARVLLLQLEVPLDAVVAAAEAARARGVFVILDPAPAQELPDALYAAADLITPNESEATLLTGIPISDTASAAEAARALVARGCRAAVVKLGGRGAVWFDGQQVWTLDPHRVTVVDTVAAGDAFNGGVAAALSDGRPIAEALRWGMAAGALAVTRAGAQDAMPYRDAMLAML